MMIRRALGAAAALLVAAALPSAAQTSPARPQSPAVKATKITSVEGITEYALPNGIRVLLLPDPSRTTFTVNVTYLVGPGDEGPGETGMAHLLEHLMFLGSKKFPNLYADFIARGARKNGSTGRDMTNYYQSLPATGDNLDWILDVEADRMVNATLAKRHLQTEYSVVRNELELNETDPFHVGFYRSYALAYDWHPYGRKITGTVSDLENVPIERIHAFYRRYYQPDNAFVIVAGRIDPERTLAMIERKFGGIPRPRRSAELGNVLARRYTTEPTQDGERYGVVRRTGTMQLVFVSFHIPGGAHPDFAALDVLADVLFSNPSGRLFKDIVDTKQASTLAGFVLPVIDATLLMVQARLRLDQSVDSVRVRMERLIDSARTATYSEEEVRRAVNSQLRNTELLINDSDRLALHLSDWIATGDWRLHFYHRDQVAKVTAADVQRVAAYYLKPSNRTTVAIIPTDKPDRAEIAAVPDVARLLAGYTGGPTPDMGEFFDASPGNIDARTKRVTLPNGMSLSLLSKRTRGKKIRGQIVLRHGTESSLMGKAQLSQLTSAMLGRGTTQLTRQRMIDSLSKMTAAVAIGPNVSTTTVFIEATRANFIPVLELVAQQLRSPRFDPEELERLKKQSLVSSDAGKGNPISVGDMVLSQRLSPFPPDHPLGRASFEEVAAAINAVTVDAVREFHRTHMGASYADLALVGDFDTAEVEAAAARLFGDWKNQQPYQRIPRRFVPTESTFISVEMPDKPNAAYYAGLTVELKDDDPDFPALYLGNYIFGGPAGGTRLMNRTRVAEGITYGANSFLNVGTQDRYGTWQMNGILAPQNADRLQRAFREELDRIRNEGFSAAEVDRVKRGLVDSRAQSRANDVELVGMIAARRGSGRTMAFDEDLDRKLLALTAAEVNAAVRKYLDPKRLVLVRAGDFAKHPPPRPTP